jgi:hypothetical protein
MDRDSVRRAVCLLSSMVDGRKDHSDGTREIVETALLAIDEADLEAEAEKQRALALIVDPSDMEALAAAEHESWSGWATYSLDRQEREIRESYGPDREQAIENAVRAFRVLASTQRWRRQAATPYEDLPEKEKESDRAEVRMKLNVYRPEAD